MAFKNSLKQQSNNLLERKKKDQNGTSFSTMDSCSSSRFSFQSGFNGNPSPSLRQIESFTDVEKYRTPQDINNCQKSYQSFTDLITQLQQEKEEPCHEISELNDESFSDDSDDDEHCIWDNTEAQELGIDTKNFLNPEGNAFTFYQMYSIRSQLYQSNRVLRSTTIQEVSNISKFYEKPIKLTDMMSQQTYLDNTCALFQQLPTINKDQTPTNNQQQLSQQQEEQQNEKKESPINITCSHSRKPTEVKNVDIPQQLLAAENISKSIKVNSINELLKPLTATELPKQLLTTSVVSPKRDIPVKTFSIVDLMQPKATAPKTLTYINSISDLDISSTQPNSLVNTSISTTATIQPKKLTTVSSQAMLTPQRSAVKYAQNSSVARTATQENVSVERKNYLYKQSSKPHLPLSATRNTSAKKNSFQSPSQQQISSNLQKQLNKSINNNNNNYHYQGIQGKSPFSSPKSSVKTVRAYVVL